MNLFQQQNRKKDIEEAPLFRGKGKDKDGKRAGEITDDYMGLSSEDRQVAWAAGTERFMHRDPTYHLSENFQRSFDLIGKQAGRKNSKPAGEEAEKDRSLDPFYQNRMKEREESKGQDLPGHPWYSVNELDMADSYVAREGDEERLGRFADISFQRGNLSAAILNGTGRMMLFSCLKRTVGQEESLNLRERKLFQSYSVHKSIPESQNGIGIANRGFAKSAVGMVIDVTKDSRKSLENLEKLASGDRQDDADAGRETLRKQYPFLMTDREELLLKDYESRLKGKDLSDDERKILMDAQKRVMTVLRKKQQTKREFLEKIRQLRARAVEAEELFSSEDFLNEILEGKKAALASNGEPPKDGEDREENQETDNGIINEAEKGNM